MCTHREDELLHRAIRSCLKQTMEDFEFLLVVNGSDVEELVPALRQAYAYDDRVSVIGTPVRMLNFSLSLGLHIARAPFVARMDADDVAYPERLEKQLAFMESHVNVAVVGSSYDLIDGAGTIKGQVDLPTTDRGIRRALRFRNPVCHPSVMLRRAPVLELGGYLGGQNAEDYDLWARLTNNSQWKFANLPQPLISYNVSPNGTARRSRSAYANVAGVQLKQFLVTRDFGWLIGAFATVIRALFLAKRP